MDNKRSFWLLLQDFFINVVLTGITLTAASKFLSLTNSEQLLVGLIIFMCILMLQLYYKFLQIARDIQGTPSLREFIIQVMERLSNLSSTDILVKDLNSNLRETIEGIKTLSVKYGSNDMWVNIYWDKIRALNNHIQLTIINEAFEFDSSTFQSRAELSETYKGKPNDLFWAISSYDALDSFRTVDITDFIREIDKNFQDKMIVSVRRLFIYDHKKDLEDSKFLLLIYLHEKSNYECRVINRADFDSVYRDFGDKTLYKDFGIHSDSHIWETPPENMITQVGIMCRNKVKYNKYKKLYEKLWENSFDLRVKRNDIMELCENKRLGDFRELVNTYEDTN